MIAHAHTFEENRSTGRWRCPCGVYGRKVGHHRLVALVCQQEVARADGNRAHCGAEVVYTRLGGRNASRCIEHAPVNGTNLAARAV